ncbi:DUF692 domain-containing protein [Parafrankia sp. FMc2]|uniref:DUF692 domain-containing protein n=1 Tax=Parafrankia sp. FMc2 TaxID=3233196 RepID=UPI0034D67631
MTTGAGLALGCGIGWRPEIDAVIAELPEIGFVEVIAENVDPDRLPPGLVELRARGVPVIPHGVSLNLGGADRPERPRLARLAAVAEALGAPLVSEHMAFCRVGALDSGHLLPVPRTREALAVIVRNVRAARAALPVPLALENVAPLLGWPDDELTEGQFVGELVERADVGLLLDVANLHTARVNLGLADPLRELDELPLERLAYVHVAGGVLRHGLWHDTHTHPLAGPVLDLLAAAASRVDLPGFLLERDGAYPSAAGLAAELAQIRATVASASPPTVGSPSPSRLSPDRPPVDRPSPDRAMTAAAAPALSSGGRALSSGGRASRRPGRDSWAGWGRAALGRSTPGGEGDRRKLGRAQRALLAALVAGAPLPAGFDADRVEAQAAALVEKRLWGVAHRLPDLVDQLDGRFPHLFRDYAAGTPRPPGGLLADARAFAAFAARHLGPGGAAVPGRRV